MQRKANTAPPNGTDETPKVCYKPRIDTRQQTVRNCNYLQCGVGIVFASDGSGGLVVKGFVPRSTAAKSGLIQEHDLLVRVDGTDVHRWPVSEIAPLMLGPAGSSVTLGFLRRMPTANECQGPDDPSNGPSNGAMKSKVPKLWKQGETPRNDAVRYDLRS